MLRVLQVRVLLSLGAIVNARTNYGRDCMAMVQSPALQGLLIDRVVAGFKYGLGSSEKEGAARWVVQVQPPPPPRARLGAPSRGTCAAKKVQFCIGIFFDMQK